MIIASIYHMYLKRNMDIPYFRTCMTIVGPLGILIAVLVGIFNFKLSVLPGLKYESNSSSKLIVILCFYGLLILGFYSLFRESKLLDVKVSERQIQLAKRMVPVLFITLIIVLTLLFIIKGIEKGTM